MANMGPFAGHADSLFKGKGGGGIDGGAAV